MALLLGVDVGTYSSKGVLTELDGTVLQTHVVEHTVDFPKPGWAEQDADAVWWRDVQAVCRALLSGDYSGDDVAGVALSAIGPCALPLDADGVPLRKGILYGVDTRASAEIDLLNERIGEEVIYDLSGTSLTSQAVGPKILWLRRNEPDVWERTRHLVTASSYLVYKLTGEFVMDRHTASHYAPLIDIKTLEWSGRFAGHFDDGSLEMLPKLGWSDELAGHVTQAAADATGLKAGTPVAVGAVDALSEALSVGVTEPGDLMVMYGSTAFFILVLASPAPDKRTWLTAGAFEKQYALAAGMSTTGSLTRWFRDEFAKDLPEGEAYADLFAAAEQVSAGSDGLLMLPYFSGERTPISDPNARGVVAGLTLSHTREHLFRAALEGVGYGIRHNLETFEEIGAPVERLVAVGGGAQSDTWVQIVSDIAGVTQEVPAVTLGASYGDAFLAGRAAGQLTREDLGTWVKQDRLIEPRSDTRALHDRQFALFKRLYEETKEVDSSE